MRYLLNQKKISLIFFYYFLIVVFSSFINYWTASDGVYPIDTFVHFDTAYRILIGEHPVKDFWIVHGLFVDYIQSLFFKLFGVGWNSYVLHSTIFNVVIALLTFQILKFIKLGHFLTFLLAICTSVLAYPVSGTPFLDLHSTYFSLIAIYFLILAIDKSKNIYFSASVFFFGFAFFCKQVPAGYIILGITVFLFYYSCVTKSFSSIKFSLIGTSLFFLFFGIFLLQTKIELNDLFFQLIIFPASIAKERYAAFNLNLNNVFFNFKFIYFFLLPLIFFVAKSLVVKRDFDNKNINYTLIFIIFTISLIYHQIYTKNQIFIFFIIPILCGFLIKMINIHKIKKKKYLEVFLILVCIFATYKYHNRFNIERKFHELNKTDLKKGIKVGFKQQFFNNLKWISPKFPEPKLELNLIEDTYEKLEKDLNKIILISNYTFYSSLLDRKLYSPSRTYDQISYPQLKSKYYERYKSFFRKNIIKNDIKSIYIFYTEEEINQNYLNIVLLNYVPYECLKLDISEKYFKKYSIIDCNYFKKKI